MKKFARFVCIAAAVGTLFASGPVLAAERILYIPLDNRPVNLDYPVETFRKAGVEVVTPPEALLASHVNKGEPDRLQTWLDEEAPYAEAAVVAADSLIYGGLTSSRTHEIPADTLQRRLGSLLSFKKKHPGVPLYAFSTVMRSPRESKGPEEPAYYAEWGPKLFHWGALRDRQDLNVLTKKEKKELQQLQQEIPETIQRDLLGRRTKNREILNHLYDAAQEGDFDYYLIARDDSAPYSEAHYDVRRIESGRKKSYQVRSFSGTDELGMLLLTRAYFKARGRTPIVHAWYAEGAGPETVPDYEDGPVRNSYRNHVLAIGAFPARTGKRADLVVGIYTPVNGRTPGADTPANTDQASLEQERFLDETARWLHKGYPTGIADIAFGNGSSDALVKALFTRRLAPGKEAMAWDLASYAGWNTASNSLGYTLGQGLMAPFMTDESRRDLLAVRYLDDWAYQAHVRQVLRYQLVYPKQWRDGQFTKAQQTAINQRLDAEMKTVSAPVLGKGIAEAHRYGLPWNRTFEVSVR